MGEVEGRREEQAVTVVVIMVKKMMMRMRQFGGDLLELGLQHLSKFFLSLTIYLSSSVSGNGGFFFGGK